MNPALVETKTDLWTKIRTRQAKAGVIGLGYVGLPLACEFAKAGLDVWGIDIDTKKIDALSRGESYIQDVPRRFRPRLHAQAQ